MSKKKFSREQIISGAVIGVIVIIALVFVLIAFVKYSGFFTSPSLEGQDWAQVNCRKSGIILFEGKLSPETYSELIGHEVDYFGYPNHKLGCIDYGEAPSSGTELASCTLGKKNDIKISIIQDNEDYYCVVGPEEIK